MVAVATQLVICWRMILYCVDDDITVEVVVVVNAGLNVVVVEEIFRSFSFRRSVNNTGKILLPKEKCVSYSTKNAFSSINFELSSHCRSQFPGKQDD